MTTEKKPSRNMVQSYGSKGRSDLLQFDPQDITLVTDKKHALYDPRVHLPVDEATVRNMMVNGVLEPILVRKNGEKDGKAIVECIAGRQRVKAALEANRRLVAEGKEPIRVPATVRRGDEATLFGILISENEIRHGETPMSRAEKVARYMNMGRSEEDASIAFGVGPQTIRNLLALMDCAPAVQKAVEAGQLTATMAALDFAKIPREDQEAALERLLAAGPVKGEEAQERIRAIREKKPVSNTRIRKRPVLKAAVKALAKLDRKDAEVACAVLKWVLGSDNALPGFPAIEAALYPEEG